MTAVAVSSSSGASRSCSRLAKRSRRSENWRAKGWPPGTGPGFADGLTNMVVGSLVVKPAGICWPLELLNISTTQRLCSCASTRTCLSFLNPTLVGWVHFFPIVFKKTAGKSVPRMPPGNRSFWTSRSLLSCVWVAVSPAVEKKEVSPVFSDPSRTQTRRLHHLYPWVDRGHLCGRSAPGECRA